ncbi:hypothetical protein D3C81_1940810 [compost metagenome]
MVALLAHKGTFHAPGGAQRQVRGEAFGAEAAEVARVLLVTADLADLTIGHAQDNAAAYAAVGADAAYFGAGHGAGLLVQTQKAPAAPACLASEGNTAPLS